MYKKIEIPKDLKYVVCVNPRSITRWNRNSESYETVSNFIIGKVYKVYTISNARIVVKNEQGQKNNYSYCYFKPYIKEKAVKTAKQKIILSAINLLKSRL